MLLVYGTAQAAPFSTSTHIRTDQTTYGSYHKEDSGDQEIIGVIPVLGEQYFA
jgi:hypothetical protein